MRYTSRVFTLRQIREASEAFAALEIKPTNSGPAIQKAYIQRIKDVHPDFMGGDTSAAAQVNVANALLKKHKDDSTLTGIVTALREAAQAGSSQTDDDIVEGLQRPGGSWKTSVPRSNEAAVLDYVGGGEFTLYLYGEFLRGNLRPRAAVGVLMKLIGPGYESRLDDIRVWVFVRNKSMNLIPLGDLGAYLANAIPADEGPVDAPSGRRAPLKSAASGEPPAQARPNTEEAPPEGLEETFRQVDWRGMFIGYVLLVEGGSIRVFRLKRSRGQLDVSYFGSYVSSAAALLALSRKGLNPDIVPVWVLSDVLGTEPTRLGAA